MRLGVVFPQTEIGNDPAVIREYAQAAESAGYDHLLVFDHVLGGKLERFDKLGRTPPYTDQSAFRGLSAYRVLLIPRSSIITSSPADRSRACTRVREKASFTASAARSVIWV